MSTSLQDATSTSALLPVATGPPTALTILLRKQISDMTDFFPFDDLANLSPKDDNDAFTFRALIESGIGGSQEILLLETGCQIDGVTDCPRACNDTEYFFGSMETFYNCAALASISYWTQDSMMYFISDEAEKNASAVMGEGSLREFDDRPILESFVGCALESCRDDGLGEPCHEDIRTLSKDDSSAEEILAAMAHFCPAIEAEINPDIFGPGVLISYVLQVSFATLLYLAVKLFTLYVKLTNKPPGAARRRSPYTLTRIQTMIWPDSSALSRTSVAIATTLVEFQEAQCWFIFAVQIASILAIVVNSQEGTFWGEMLVNAAVAFHVSQNGILPMFLVQILLHNEGIRNTHTFVGFLIEYILAIIAASQKVHFRKVFELFRGQASMEACGGNPSPRTYCAAIGAVDGLQLNFFPHPLLYKVAFLVLDTIAILVLLVDQVAWTLRKHRRTKNIRLGRHRVGRFPETRLKPYWVRAKRWFWWLLEVIYIVVTLLYMVSLIKIITAESFEPNRWSYGQIIAMTVWGPVIVKMFDLVISGPQKNGMSMNSGPPRLRIDNTINLRLGTSVDDNFDARNKRLPAAQPIPPREPEETLAQTDSDGKTALPVEGGEDSRDPSPDAGISTRDMALQEHDPDDSTNDDIERKQQ